MLYSKDGMGMVWSGQQGTRGGQRKSGLETDWGDDIERHGMGRVWCTIRRRGFAIGTIT